MAKDKVDYSTDKFRNWEIVLYPENEYHKKALKEIASKYEYIAILHDRFSDDEKEENENKKVHYHVVVAFKNQRKRKPIAKELKVEENLLTRVKNMDGMLRYLIHKDDEDKFQYEEKDCFGTDEMKFKQKVALNKSTDKEEVVKVMRIIAWIENNSKYIKYVDLIRFVCSCDLYDVYRRGGYNLNRVLEEHNEKYMEKTPKNQWNSY